MGTETPASAAMDEMDAATGLPAPSAAPFGLDSVDALMPAPVREVARAAARFGSKVSALTLGVAGRNDQHLFTHMNLLTCTGVGPTVRPTGPIIGFTVDSFGYSRRRESEVPGR
ncbi:hypothetical protein GCM10018963_60030 [Saccharothrix longispora]